MTLACQRLRLVEETPFYQEGGASFALRCKCPFPHMKLKKGIYSNVAERIKLKEYILMRALQTLRLLHTVNGPSLPLYFFTHAFTPFLTLFLATFPPSARDITSTTSPFFIFVCWPILNLEMNESLQEKIHEHVSLTHSHNIGGNKAFDDI